MLLIWGIGTISSLIGQNLSNLSDNLDFLSYCSRSSLTGVIMELEKEN